MFYTKMVQESIMTISSSNRIILLFLFSIAISSNIVKVEGKSLKVTYDGRSILINGKRELFYSGSIHYPRSPPELWPDILEKASRGGINVIQTYVFWNAHEPVKGKMNFEGKNDIVKFIKLVQEKGMYVTIRFGPFIQAEWNHGGLPYWLREIPDIIFRSDNEPFKKVMKEYVQFFVDKLRSEKLFAADGGPIIMAQIENEYNHVQRAYRERGNSYVQWAAKLAMSMNVDVPWVMCKQKDAPDPVINACNGRHCGDTFSGPNKPYKPFIWTENWTAQYRVFGDPPSQRSAEDIAFSVARFYAKKGCLVNYYMYHGGTNFGRTTSAFTATRYYDEAPLDEFGLQKEPKWSHLRDVHKSINLCKKALLEGTPSVQKINDYHEVIVYEKKGTELCSAFITNNHTQESATIAFRDQQYFLPAHSISILPDCKTVVFNTQTIVSQHNERKFRKPEASNKLNWEVFSEIIPTTKEIPVDSREPKELYDLLKDVSDYAWYTTGIELGPEDMPWKESVSPVIRCLSLGHGLLAFVNGEFVGLGHGTHEEKSFGFEKPITLKIGLNHISILAYTVGLPDSGAYMEHRYAGLKSVAILGLNTGTIDLSANGWGHQVSLKGEKDSIFTEEGSNKVQWQKASGPGRPVSWYKARFTSPDGNDPLAVRMNGMGKGQIWVNGKSIGRHWMSFLSPLKQPSQSEYHIPRAFLNEKGKDNLIVILEEEDKSEPEKIEILTVDRDTICSFVTDRHPPNVRQFAIKKMKFHTVVDNAAPEAALSCSVGKKVVSVDFASFGDPQGFCGGYKQGNCSSASAKQVVEQNCLGKDLCFVPLDPKLFPLADANCQNLDSKALAVQLTCSV